MSLHGHLQGHLPPKSPQYDTLTRLPTSTGLPRLQSGLGPGCRRLWSPRSVSTVPASHGNPPSGAACCSAPFCAAYRLFAPTGPSSTWVQHDVAGANHHPLEVRLINERIQKVFPYPMVPPSAEATMGGLPVSQVLRQIPPGSPSKQVPKHRVQEQPVVSGWAPIFPWFTRQERFKKFPNPVGNVVASMRCLHVPTPHVHSGNTNLPSCYDFDDIPNNSAVPPVCSVRWRRTGCARRSGPGPACSTSGL